MSAPAQDRSTASTFAKGMAILAAFDGSRPSLTLADLARATGQDRATARRGALTLMQLGYLCQDGRDFRLTPKVLMLAGGFLQANRFGRDVQPVLNHYAAELGHEITLATRDGHQVLLLAQSAVQNGPVSFGFTLGSRLPLLHTGLGRMLLACEDDAGPLVQAAPLPQHTAESLQDRAAILAAVAAIRDQGFAATDGEFEPGIVGYALPVSRPGAAPVVVGASRPRDAATDHGRDDMLRGLRLCAADLRQSGALDSISAA